MSSPTMRTNRIKIHISSVLTLLLYVAAMLPIINWGVVVYFFYRQRQREVSFERHKTLTCIIYFTAWLGLFAALASGLKHILFFIPHSWGTYGEEGNWHPLRMSIAGIVSLFCSLFIVDAFDKYGRLSRKLSQLVQENENERLEKERLRELLETYEEDDDEEDEDDDYGDEDAH